MRTDKQVVDALDQLLRSAASTRAIAELAEELEQRARAGAAGDRDAFAVTQRALFRLYENRDSSSRPLRTWLADRIEAAGEPLVATGPTLSPERFIDRVREQDADRRGGHPLSRHLFEGNPSLDDFRIYMRHHFHRSRSFYRCVADLAANAPLEHAGPLYENMYEETGAGGRELPHPLILAPLLEYLDLPVLWDDEPVHVEALIYLNNRYRCARHPSLGWGLGMLWAVERGTGAQHKRLLALEQRLAIPDEVCHFHRLHSTLDEGHADDLLRLASRALTTGDEQAAFVASVQRHLDLGARYFDRIWDEVRLSGGG